MANPELFGRVFGNPRRQWEKAGYRGASYDVKLSKDHDLVTLAGAMNFLELGLTFLD